MRTVKAVVEIAVEYDQPGDMVSDATIESIVRGTIRQANLGLKVNDFTVLRWFSADDAGDPGWHKAG